MEQQLLRYIFDKTNKLFVKKGFKELPLINLRFADMYGYHGKIYGLFIIYINRYLLDSKQYEQIEDTMIHECVHLYCYNYHNHIGHGGLFKNILNTVNN